MSTDFVAHCLELLAPLGALRARRMFGGHGLYCDEHFFAIVVGERLYLKVDAQTRSAFEAIGCEPFVYDAKRGAVALGYWSAPADAMESPVPMQPWGRLALAAALRARAAKTSSTRAAPRKKAATGRAAQSGNVRKRTPSR